VDHSERRTLAVRDADISEALRLFEDCAEAMARNSTAITERAMKDRSGTGGIADITLQCGTARFRSRFELRKLAAGGS
jgi:hypothetical protein